MFKFDALLSEIPQLCFSHILLSGPSISCHYCLCAAPLRFLILVLISGRELALVTFKRSRVQSAPEASHFVVNPYFHPPLECPRSLPVFSYCSQFDFQSFQWFLLAIFDFEIHVFHTAFFFFLSWFHVGFVDVGLIIIWPSFLYKRFRVFCLEVQEFILTFKVQKLYLPISWLLEVWSSLLVICNSWESLVT